MNANLPESLESQVERLANFIIQNVPGEPSQSQGAVDTAIRLLTALQSEKEVAERERDELTSSLKTSKNTLMVNKGGLQRMLDLEKARAESAIEPARALVEVVQGLLYPAEQYIEYLRTHIGPGQGEGMDEIFAKARTALRAWEESPRRAAHDEEEKP